MASLPYVTAHGNIPKALEGIKNAATPDYVSQDFVKTVLNISGGSGSQMTSYLKRIGFAEGDGKPTDLYKRFRNSATQGAAAAESLKIGYAPLYKRNEYLHKLDDAKLRGLILEETGASADSSVTDCVLNCIKQLKKYATWEPKAEVDTPQPSALAPIELPAEPLHRDSKLHGKQPRMNLAYTINLNLPATTDIAVFNAIFKSLKEHLLKGSDE